VELLDPTWKQWYRYEHESRCRAAGEAFEDYVTTILTRLHSDFVNPKAMGSLGDGGCDGLAEAGVVFYACYGSQATTGIDAKVAKKLADDFARAVQNWGTFTRWCFITNAPFGPTPTAKLTELRRAHGPTSERPLTLDLWQAPEDLWWKAASKLTADQVMEFIPGLPRARDVQLSDLVELIMSLESHQRGEPDDMSAIRPVPFTKMDFNQIDPKTRFEFNEGRVSAPRIDRWFDEQAEPGLRDAAAARFREIYARARQSMSDPSEIIEDVYVRLGGSDFRLHRGRANAAYAVTVYFFDSCDIFEEPPEGHQVGGDDHVASD
jgi:hypothetical protein